MITKISHISLFVHDQEEALRFYTEKLGFVKTADSPMGPDYRWLTVSPAGQTDVAIILAKAETDEHKALVGKQVGDSVLFVFLTDDCQKTYEELSAKGVHFRSQPTQQFFGIDAVCEDLYGTRIDIVQETPHEHGS